MKTKKLILSGLILVLLATSCKDYLEPWPNGNYDSENLWEYQNFVQGMINRCYDNIDAYSVGNSRRNYNDDEGVYLDGVTDDAVITSSTNVMRRYALNTMTTSQDPLQTCWDRDYRSISQCNFFLQDRRGYNTRYMIKETYNTQVRTRLQGEAFALRAFFEWDLLQKFGGKGVNGQMLGFPIVLEPVDVNSVINYPRNTYDECVARILADCDSALKYLPLAHRDFLYPSGTDLTYLGGKYWNRFDDTGVWGIMANMYLTWASPRFNPGDEVARWDSAAVNAKAVIDYKHNYDFTAAYSNSGSIKGVNYADPNSPELVMVTRYNSGNGDLEVQFMPGGYSGKGSVGPTQDLVDAFGDNAGYPITASSVYDAATPYLNRDPRFYATIFYNGSTYKQNNTGSTWYTFNTVTGGTDASGPSTNTRTNYYIKKFCSLGYNLKASSPTRPARAKFLFRR